VEKNIIEDIINQLTLKFGQDSPLITNRGDVLDYLGVTIDYWIKGKVKFSMLEYINKLLEGSM